MDTFEEFAAWDSLTPTGQRYVLWFLFREYGDNLRTLIEWAYELYGYDTVRHGANMRLAARRLSELG